MKRSMIMLAAVAGLGLGTGTSAMADSLIFDRGLPTANLNNAAGASRSNVEWADGESSSTPAESFMPGDDFTLAGTGNYQVNTIRVWTTTNDSSGLSLKGGNDGGSIGTVSNAYTLSPVTYSTGASYQTTGGSSEQLYQLDFTVNLSLMGGQKYDFFLNGPYTGSASSFASPFLHASNAALSGSPQDGSDGLYSFLHINGTTQTVEPENSATDGTWDKSSDINVQVLGTAVVPLPKAAYAGLGLIAGLGLLGGLKRRQRRLA